MALTSLHWQQPYARLQVSKENLAPVEPFRKPRFAANDNFNATDKALETALTQGGHTPEWFSSQLGGKLWRMISHAGRLFLYVSPHEAQAQPDNTKQEAAKAQLAKTLAPLGSIELRMASTDNCCGGACRGCVETPHSSHHDTWSLPVISSPEGTSPKDPRQEN